MTRATAVLLAGALAACVGCVRTTEPAAPVVPGAEPGHTLVPARTTHVRFRVRNPWLSDTG